MRFPSHLLGVKVSCERRTEDVMNKFMALWNGEMFSASFSVFKETTAEPRTWDEAHSLGSVPRRSLPRYYHFNQRNICINVTSFKRGKQKETQKQIPFRLPPSRQGLKPEASSKPDTSSRGSGGSTWKLRKFKLTDCLGRAREILREGPKHYVMSLQTVWLAFGLFYLFIVLTGESCEMRCNIIIFVFHVFPVLGWLMACES